MSSQGINVVFGGAGFGPTHPVASVELLTETFDVLAQGGCTTIDTAAIYGESEAMLGKAKSGERVTLDTKNPGGFNEGGMSKQSILKFAKESREKLGSTVDIYYIHAPDPKADLEDCLAGIDEVHRSGFFKRFGLSNFKAEDVQRVYDICKAKGYVLPSVYQGNYSAIARLPETLLLPTLRRLGMSFYAYSPLAGGFLTKSRDQVAQGAGRFEKGTFIGDMYLELYGKPSFYDALSEWADIATAEGVTRADLAYRWVRYNSPLRPEHGDAIIVGASTMDQLRETLGSINSGPLSDAAAKRIDDVWQKIGADAPLDNYHRNTR